MTRMSRMNLTTRTTRTTRTTGARASRVRLVTAAAGVALAALSLTACNDDATGARDEGASTGSSATASPGTGGGTPSGSGSAGSAGSSSGSAGSSGRDAGGSATGGSAPDGSGSQKPGGTGDGGAGNGGAQGGGGDAADDGADAPTCQGGNTKTVASPLNRPVNHMLLTVTNTGDTPCDLYHYPAVRFGEAQSVPPVIEDSKPQSVVRLAPGESGYASVNLSATDGTGAHGRTEKSLEVHFMGRDDRDDLTPATPALPAKGVYVDDSLKVTYWQREMDDAVMW